MYTLFCRDSAAQTNKDLSRDEIQYKIGEFESKKRVLQSLKRAAPTEELIEDFNRLEANLTTSNQELEAASNESERLRQLCLSSRIRAKVNKNAEQYTPQCQEYDRKTLSTTNAIFSTSELYACVKDLDFQINSVNETRTTLDEAIDAINDEIDALREQLLTTYTKFTELAQHAADTQDQLDSRWLQFEFDSSHKIRESSSSYKRFHTAAKFKASGFFWSARASFSYSRSESNFRQSMNSADVSISGELLRVTVQRPWFRPSLFKSTQFEIRVSLLYLHENPSPSF